MELIFHSQIANGNTNTEIIDDINTDNNTTELGQFFLKEGLNIKLYHFKL